MTPGRELPTGSFKRALIGVLRGENTGAESARGLRASHARYRMPAAACWLCRFRLLVGREFCVLPCTEICTLLCRDPTVFVPTRCSWVMRVCLYVGM